jgi:hypothetical protein
MEERGRSGEDGGERAEWRRRGRKSTGENGGAPKRLEERMEERGRRREKGRLACRTTRLVRHS